MSKIKTLEDFYTAIKDKSFVFAKTMKKHPHWYTLRDKWKDNKLFNDCVNFIRSNGYVEYFFKKGFTMLNLNGFKYWTMGADVDETILINKAEIKYNTKYDLFASEYTNMFDVEEYIQEEKDLISLLNIDYSKGKKILDIGCGNGMLLNHIDIDKDDYVGIDISSGLLNILNEKHKNYSGVMKTSFEDFALDYKFDVILSLFGSFNYIDKKFAPKVKDYLKEGGVAYIMVYKKEYYPLTHKETGIDDYYYDYYSDDLKDLFSLFGDKDNIVEVKGFNNYIIIKIVKKTL